MVCILGTGATILTVFVSVHLSVLAYIYVHMHVWMDKCIHTFVTF